MEESKATVYPDMDLCQKVHLLTITKPDIVSDAEKNDIKQAIMLKIATDRMTPYYEHLCAKFNWPVDEDLLSGLRQSNEAELTRINEQIASAEIDSGEMEVLDGLFLKAHFFARIGNKEAAYQAYDSIISRKKIGTGKKIDACMSKTRLSFFFCSKTEIRSGIDQCKALNDLGGDWDRRNRLKIYEALYHMHFGSLTTCSSLLLESILTFTCTELVSYDDYLFLTLLTNLLILDRNRLSDEIISNTGLQTQVPCRELINHLYQCNYSLFLTCLCDVYPSIVRNMHSGHLASKLILQLRHKAYNQFFNAYQSVSINTMASLFGISRQFLISDLIRFISSSSSKASNVQVRMDAVRDMIETKKQQNSMILYQSVLTTGDALLTRVQELVRKID